MSDDLFGDDTPALEPNDLRKQLDDANNRMLRLLNAVGEEGTCKGCGRPIFWVVHKNGKKAPYTYIGLNHFADCSAAKDFKR